MASLVIALLGSVKMAEQTNNNWMQEMRNKYFPSEQTQTVVEEDMPAPTGNFKKYIDDNYVLPAGRFVQATQKGVGGDFEDLFTRVVKQESRGKHRTPSGRLTKSRAGALGITQIMPDTGKNPGYGIAPLQDDSEEEYLRVGKSLLQAYTKSFDGDTAKGLAAYNWGPGNLRKAIDKHGVNWRDALPDETRKYLKIILGKQ